ncbi:MarR family winged helix-turn-helix transcriptional regulator [Ruminococcaceae bacterium OttesenSCG-928-O06]|nr:MarR family winged helix-turn-helix transcriptional regulator [Ruminococcaceae bacterium OttesenSCG-928-O06]
MPQEQQVEKLPCYAIRLRRAATTVTEHYNRALQPFGITINQFSLLAGVAAMDGCSVNELAARVGLDKSTLVRNLRPLFAQGYIVDTAAPGRRNRQLALTPAGRVLLQQAREVWHSTQKALKARLGPLLEPLLLALDCLDDLV